jgi:hypothetical protein
MPLQRNKSVPRVRIWIATRLVSSRGTDTSPPQDLRVPLFAIVVKIVDHDGRSPSLTVFEHLY